MSNNFANDGSFMAQFLAQQASQRATGAAATPASGHTTSTATPKDADRSPLLGNSADDAQSFKKPAPVAGRRTFTEEPDEGPAQSRPFKRKFVDTDESEATAPGLGSAPSLDSQDYNPALNFDDDAEAGKPAQEQEELVESAWGRKYKAGFVPKSSHVGNLLPEDEMAKYTTLLPGRKTTEEKKEDPNKTVLDASNAGYKMLSKMGWKAGKGLGANEDGKVAPVGAEKSSSDKSGAAAGSAHGVGSQHTWDLDGSEDVYEQYRKRMMLGYRHRPNPNNNPRKLYY